jgi:hypothetical protein
LTSLLVHCVFIDVTNNAAETPRHATIGEMFNTSAGRERLANLFGARIE